MFVVLTLIAIIAAGALAAVFSVTKDTIEQAKAKKTQDAIKAVLPTFASIEDAIVDGCPIHKAYDANHNFVGAAVEAQDDNGFGGAVKVMVGFDKSGNIVDYSVLEQKETPGLGTKMVEWFKKGNKGDISGKNPATNNITVSKDGGEIDAITASTISSRAFLRAVNKAYEVYDNANNGNVKTDANSNATTAANENKLASDTIK